MGHKARRQLRERNEDGDGLALTGIIVGWIGFALSLVMILALVAFIAINFMGDPAAAAEDRIHGRSLAVPGHGSDVQLVATADLWRAGDGRRPGTARKPGSAYAA
jgi:hypothetical protein